MIYHIPSGMAYLPYHPQPVAVPTRRHESHNMQMRCSTSTYDQTFFCSAVSFMEFPIHQILPATVRRLQESVILCQFGVDMHLVLSLHWHSFYLNFCICLFPHNFLSTDRHFTSWRDISRDPSWCHSRMKKRKKKNKMQNGRNSVKLLTVLLQKMSLL